MVDVLITLKAFVTLPEGSAIAERGRGIHLPNGDWLKPWVVLERNDSEDMDTSDLAALGVYLDDMNFQYEVREA